MGQRKAQWPVGCGGDTGVPGQGTCRRNKEGCSSHRSPAARGLTGAGSLIKHGSVIRICSPAQETWSGSDRHVLEPRRQTSGGCPVRGRSSGAPSAVLGLSGAGLTQGGGHGAAGSSEDVLRKSPWRPAVPGHHSASLGGVPLRRQGLARASSGAGRDKLQARRETPWPRCLWHQKKQIQKHK